MLVFLNTLYPSTPFILVHFAFIEVVPLDAKANPLTFSGQTFTVTCFKQLSLSNPPGVLTVIVAVP